MVARVRFLLPLLLLAQQPAAARAATNPNRSFATTRTIEDVALSSDGRAVAAAITDPTEEGGRSHLWLLAPSGQPRRITGTGAEAARDETGPAWTRDGRAILYLARSGGGAAVGRVDPASGRNETLFLARQGSQVVAAWQAAPAGRAMVVKGFASSPSGMLAIWATDPADTTQKTARKDDQHVFGQSDPVRLYLIGESGAPRVIALPDDVGSVAWSRDSGSLLVVTKPASDDLGAPNRLWLIGQNDTASEIAATAADVQAASWLPDGRVAYFARCARDAPIVCRDLFVQKLDGSPPRNLTDGIDGSVLNGAENGAKSGPVVTAAGDILVTVARRFDEQVARIRPADGHVAWIETLQPVVKAIATNADRTGFALLAAERGGVTSAYLAAPQLRAATALATPPLQPADWAPLQARRLEWASDGQRIDGLLYLPAGAAADRRVPLVVDVHGGPAGRFEDGDYPLVRLLLAQGWGVLHVNPRGSFGYGVAFLASLKDDLGGGDYRDIMAGVDAALATGTIDRERLALIGFSYGASMATVTLGRTDRFKALVAAAPVVDQVSEYGTEGSSWYDRWYFGQPWRRLDQAWRQSALAGVAAARTPLLLLHGESDPVNPVGQSLEFYRALRQEGSPVELVLFPRETHHELGRNFYGYSSVEPAHGIALRQRIVDFLGDAFAGRPHAGLAMPDRPAADRTP